MRKELYNQKKINFLSNSRNVNLSIPLQNIAITLFFAFFLGYSAQAQSPTTNSPDPTENPADVVSIFSDSYTNVPVANFDPNWGQSGHTQVNTTFDPTGTGTNFALAYPNFNYQGTEIGSNLDLSGMDFLHVDIWVAAGTNRMVKVSPINNGTGAGEVLVEVPLTPGSWNSVALPKSAFTGMTWNSVFQLKFDGQFNADGSANTTPYDVYLDNIYFSQNSGGGTEPPVPVGFVASDNIGGTPVGPGEVFLACGPNQVDGNIVYRLYFELTSAGVTDPITEANEYIFGSTGGDGGGFGPFGFVISGLDPGVEYTFWLYQYDTLLDLFSDGAAIATQVSGAGGGGGNEPLTAAPDPTEDPADVISMFSDVYTDVPVDTWLTPWSSAALEDILIDGNPTKKYTNVDFFGIETVGPNLIDASEMDFFHIDVWTPNMTTFRVKLVDFGADGGFGGGDDSEHEIIFEDLTLGEWNSLQIPLDDFVGLTGRENLAQLILSGLPVGAGTLFVDNVYYSKTSTGGNEPLTAAPDPTEDPADVISMFSDVYTDVPVDTWLTPWSSAALEDILIDGNPTKKYTNVDFLGIETVGPNLIDASEMDFFHIDVWTPNMTSFRVKLVDFGADGGFGGGDDSEHEIIFEDLTLGEWNSLQIPLDDFVGLTGRENLAQLILSGLPVGAGTLFVDNVYYSKTPAAFARVQVIHNSADPGAEFVDVYLDDVLLLEDFEFRTATPFVDVPADVPVSIDIAPAGSTSSGDSIYNLTATLDEGETYLVIATGVIDPSQFDASVNNPIDFRLEVYAGAREAATDPANTDVLVHHGATDAPTVDVVETSVPAGIIVDDISFPEFQGYLELLTGDYEVDVTTADGSVVVQSYFAPLATLGLDGAAITVLASGFLDPSANQDGASFGLWVALPSGGALIELPSPIGCGDEFTDTGGAAGDYSNNEDVVWTIEPDNVDDFVTVIFTEFDVESNWDALYVFDGPDTSSPLISSGNPPTTGGFPAGGWYGTNIPGPFASTHPSGALTFRFLSDGSVTRPGWVADVVCAPVPPPNDLIENAISVTAETQPYTDPAVRLQYATNELLNPDGCAIAGTPGVWYSFTAEIDGTAEASITDPSGTSFVIFYEAPSEDVGDETDLSFSPEPDNQCGPSTASNITTVAGQSYYIFVLNNGGPSDVVVDISGSLLSTVDNTIDGFTFYPNPTMDVLNLRANSSIDTVELYNMLGQKVISQEIGATASQVNVSNLATGTYIMKVTAQGLTASYQVIKK